ncbi:MAG: hypothetical protein PHD48_04385 [Alphaproteobacteria bacterium]|nr:hypothetical protein [Alphaproteobacteria bacterium]
MLLLFPLFLHNACRAVIGLCLSFGLQFFFACAFIGLAISLFFYDARGQIPVVPQNQQADISSPVTSPSALDPARAVADGIALPAEAMSLLSEQQEALSEVEKQLIGVPMLSESEGGHVVPCEGCTVDRASNSVGSSSLASNLRQATKAALERNWITALSLYDDILQTSPHNRKAIDGKIFVLEQGAFADSFSEIEDMIDANPVNASLYAAYARMLAAQDRAEEALMAGKRAASLDPKNQALQLSLAILYDRVGQEDAALNVYRQIRSKFLPVEAKRRMDYLATRLRGKKVVQGGSTISPTLDSQEE